MRAAIVVLLSCASGCVFTSSFGATDLTGFVCDADSDCGDGRACHAGRCLVAECRDTTHPGDQCVAADTCVDDVFCDADGVARTCAFDCNNDACIPIESSANLFDDIDTRDVRTALVVAERHTLTVAIEGDAVRLVQTSDDDGAAIVLDPTCGFVTKVFRDAALTAEARPLAVVVADGIVVDGTVRVVSDGECGGLALVSTGDVIINGVVDVSANGAVAGCGGFAPTGAVGTAGSHALPGAGAEASATFGGPHLLPLTGGGGGEVGAGGGALHVLATGELVLNGSLEVRGGAGAPGGAGGGVLIEAGTLIGRGRIRNEGRDGGGAGRVRINARGGINDLTYDVNNGCRSVVESHFSVPVGGIRYNAPPPVRRAYEPVEVTLPGTGRIFAASSRQGVAFARGNTIVFVDGEGDTSSTVVEDVTALDALDIFDFQPAFAVGDGGNVVFVGIEDTIGRSRVALSRRVGSPIAAVGAGLTDAAISYIVDGVQPGIATERALPGLIERIPMAGLTTIAGASNNNGSVLIVGVDGNNASARGVQIFRFDGLTSTWADFGQGMGFLAPPASVAITVDTDILRTLAGAPLDDACASNAGGVVLGVGSPQGPFGLTDVVDSAEPFAEAGFGIDVALNAAGTMHAARSETGSVLVWRIELNGDAIPMLIAPPADAIAVFGDFLYAVVDNNVVLVEVPPLPRR